MDVVSLVVSERFFTSEATLKIEECLEAGNAVLLNFTTTTVRSRTRQKSPKTAPNGPKRVGKPQKSSSCAPFMYASSTKVTKEILRMRLLMRLAGAYNLLNP